MAEQKKEVCMFFRGIPRSLRNQFKAYCIRRETTMTEELIRYMRSCARKERTRK